MKNTTSFLAAVCVCVSGVSGQNWCMNYPTRRVCVLRGSSVDISSTYTHPSDHKITKAFWFKGKTVSDLKDDSEYTGRVEYHGNKDNHHTLRITDLRETDSAEYKFRMITDGGGYSGSPGVHLTVTGNSTQTHQISSTNSSFQQIMYLSCHHQTSRWRWNRDL